MTHTTPRKGSFMNVEIAQRLATMRREKGYSQEELAERLGLSRQAVSKWERAESSPDIGNIVALAKLYGVTVDELLRVDDEVEDDVRFEEVDKTATAQAEAQEAAVRANEAAVRAAQAAVAAAQARATAEQAAPAPQPQAPYAPQVPAPAVPASPQQAGRKRGPWSTFPYPILCVIVFMLAGFGTGWWHPAWIVFLTIPLYYWIARIIENDPNYRDDHR